VLKEELMSHIDIINTSLSHMGKVMREIRDQRLYRAEYRTFEDFCKSLVHKDKRYMNRVIQAADVIEELMLQGVDKDELPNSERICRELANYPTSSLKLIYKRARQMALAKASRSRFNYGA
jgi:hypothetical protein